MTELSFAKAFLSTLDSRPIKLQADYAIDPKQLELKGPYTLPRMPQPMRRASKPSAPGSAPAVTVSLKSLRNPPLDLTFPAQAVTTSVLELKQKVAEHLGTVGTDRVRLLFKKKPCADSKSIKDLIGGEAAKEAEFSVMIIGGVSVSEPAAAEPQQEDINMQEAPAAQGDTGVTAMKKQDFWRDLQGFLEQRVRDQAVAEKAAKLFQEVWKEKGDV